jgi:SAM-dependent methyltransferase
MPNPRILDVGCGFDTKTLALIPGRRFGIDLVTTFVPAPGVHVMRASGDALPFADQSFDIVCCRSVLEHVENPGALFEDVKRVLRPNGVFVIVTPNRWDYISLLSAAVPNAWHPKLVHLLTGRHEEKTFPTLYRANTLPALRRLADRAGLRVEQLTLCRQHPHYLRKSLVLYTIGVGFEQLVQKPFPSLRPMILGTFRRPA